MKLQKEQLIQIIKEELNNLLSEYTMVDDYFDLYESLQDAVDEDGNTPCPQCLYEMMVDADCGCPNVLTEAEYKGRKVKLNKRMRGDVKKFKVFVKGCGKDKSRVKKINFGDSKTALRFTANKALTHSSTRAHLSSGVSFARACAL